eukprot:COSAG01_NODE_4927_length_4613_cov_1.410671_4_plen_279_part_00
MVAVDLCTLSVVPASGEWRLSTEISDIPAGQIAVKPLRSLGLQWGGGGGIGGGAGDNQWRSLALAGEMLPFHRAQSHGVERSADVAQHRLDWHTGAAHVMGRGPPPRRPSSEAHTRWHRQEAGEHTSPSVRQWWQWWPGQQRQITLNACVRACVRACMHGSHLSGQRRRSSRHDPASSAAAMCSTFGWRAQQCRISSAAAAISACSHPRRWPPLPPAPDSQSSPAPLTPEGGDSTTACASASSTVLREAPIRSLPSSVLTRYLTHVLIQDASSENVDT